MHYPYLRILYVSELSRGTTEEDLIARPAAVESNSKHPLAKAIVLRFTPSFPVASDVTRRTDRGSLRDQYLRIVPFAVLDALELRLRRMRYAMCVIRMDLIDGDNGSFSGRFFRGLDCAERQVQ